MTVYQDPHLHPEVQTHGGHNVMGELVISVAEEQRGLAHPGISHHQHLQVNQVVWLQMKIQRGLRMILVKLPTHGIMD